MILYKYVCTGLLLLQCVTTLLNAQIMTIPFDGNKIIINGTMEYLTVLGHGESNIKIQNGANTNPTADYIDYNIDGKTIQLGLKDRRQNVKVFVPSGLEIEIKPNAIVEESYSNKDYGFIDLKDLNGPIELEADGYHVDLKNVKGQVSLVTYGDINAILPKQNTANMLSLDTYSGNIKIKVQPDKKYAVRCNAVSGDVIIDSDVLQDHQSNPSIIAHAESGKYIKLETLKDYPIDQILNPNFRDEIVQLYLKYLGKKQIHPELEKCIIQEGYENQLKTLSVDGAKKINQEKLDFLIKKYGFPTKEMIGDGLAWSAVSEIFLWSDTQFMESYEDEYVENFGWYNFKLNRLVNQLKTQKSY